MTEPGGQPIGKSGEGEEKKEGEPRPKLAARFRNLSAEGKHRSGIRLARSILRNADVRRLDVDSSTITVETDHFVGTHEYHTDDGIAIEEGGSYRCTIDGVDLSFETASMNRDAYREARNRIDAAIEDGSDPVAGETADDETVSGRPNRLVERLRRWLG